MVANLPLTPSTVQISDESDYDIWVTDLSSQNKTSLLKVICAVVVASILSIISQEFAVRYGTK